MDIEDPQVLLAVREYIAGNLFTTNKDRQIVNVKLMDITELDRLIKYKVQEMLDEREAEYINENCESYD